MGKPIIIAVLVALLGLTGCESVLSSANQYSGINYGEVDFVVDEDGNLRPENVVIYGGKEQGSIEVSFELPSGHKFEYKATDVKAFEGQKFRADLEDKLAETFADFGKETITAIADVVIKALVPVL